MHDSVSAGGKRGIGLNDERDQTLNQLLTELDGFDARTGVLMLAATNRPEVRHPHRPWARKLGEGMVKNDMLQDIRSCPFLG